MTTDQACSPRRSLRDFALRLDGGGLTDGQLLECFLSRREEAAFAALVRRHGSMVLGVCRRVLHNPHDADDAFQAAFLVLVRHAAVLTPRATVGNWLHGVAYHVALKARAVVARRRAVEAKASLMPTRTARPVVPQPDWQPLLDEELQRLPAAYREALILCDLEGRTRKEAARLVGVPEGTLSGRLTKARRLLATRLARRGVTLSAGALATTLLAGLAQADVPAALIAATTEVAHLTSTGATAAARAVAARAVALAEGALTTMNLRKLMLLTLLVLGLGLVCGLAVYAMQAGVTVARSQAARGVTGAKALGEATPPLTLEEPVSRLRWSRDGKVMASVSVREVEADDKKSYLHTFRIWDGETGKLKHSLGEAAYPGFMTFGLSPDGRFLAISQRGRIEVGDRLQLWDTAKGELIRTIEMDYERARVWFAFNHDGSIVAVCGVDVKLGRSQGTARLFDTATGQLKQKIVRDDISEIIALTFSEDGKLLAVGGHQGEVLLLDLASEKALMRGVAPQAVAALALAADGKQLLSTGAPSGVLLWDTATGQARELAGEATGEHVAFSPDGRFVAAVGRFQGEAETWGLRVWNTRTAEVLHTWPREGWRGFTFTPDSESIAMVQDDQRTIVTRGIEKTAAAAGQRAAADPKAEELKKLQGEWQAVEIQTKGTTAGKDDQTVKVLRFVIKDMDLTIPSPLNDGRDRKKTFKVDPSKKPKEIDITSLDGQEKDTTAACIYQLDKNKLTICMPCWKDYSVRPKDFKAGADDGLMLIVLEREMPR